MVLTTAQLQTIKAHILASPDMSTKQPNEDGAFAIRDLFSLIAVPDFFVWRTDVTRASLYNDTSGDGTTWDWTIYKGQSATEQGAWTQMFMGDRADFSKVNLRAGIAKIFGANNANNTHCLAMGRRQATRIEKLLASGTGSTASPATMTGEGLITIQQIVDARNS